MDDEVRWLVEQTEFTADHLARRAAAERRRVKLLWWTATASAARGPDVTGLIARLWTGRAGRGAQHLFVAMFEPDDPVGARPFLVLRAQPGEAGPPEGRALATVHGRAEPGGVLVVETAVGTIVPVEPPAAPGDGAPSWAETGPA